MQKEDWAAFELHKLDLSICSVLGPADGHPMAAVSSTGPSSNSLIPVARMKTAHFSATFDDWIHLVERYLGILEGVPGHWL